ncbi:RlpA-like double-psi beta-barrel-protein domain-containing protein-containing protein [Pterulicium gracile]|uniref:RlpA-like double-psi beta-barrel-protein domain-containing protein-containing protein n=1 Tax=Pterulicium gracile TaxID=1884261 RepID=A0A5C3QYT7_9AGAR|nr:RlpA-like double-psi beta-barrel-protein domain-containing protein-containing protein [Pterula gracilis]
MNFTALFSFSMVSVLALMGLIVPSAAAPASTSLETRWGRSGKASWFNVGLGSCGQYSSDSDMLVAVSPGAFSSGIHCGQKISVSANGHSVTATVLDKCPSCGDGDLDMSPALFQKFNDLGKGVFSVSWSPL